MQPPKAGGPGGSKHLTPMINDSPALATYYESFESLYA